MPDFISDQQGDSQKVARLFQKLQGLPQAVGVGSLGVNSTVPPAVNDFIQELNNANLTRAEQVQLTNLIDNIGGRTLHQFLGSGRYPQLARVRNELRIGAYTSSNPQSVRDITAQMNQNTSDTTQPQAATTETNTAETPAASTNEPAPAENTNTVPTQETSLKNTNTTSTPETPAPTSPSQETPAQETTTQETTSPEEEPEEEPTRGAGLGVEAEDEENAETPIEEQQRAIDYYTANNGVPYNSDENNVPQGPSSNPKDYSYATDTEGNRTMMNEPGEITPENSTISSVRDVTRQMRARTAARARPAEQQQQQPTAQPTNTAQAPAPQRRYTSAEIEGVDNSDIAPVNQGWYDYISNQGYGSTSSILSQMGYSQDKIRRMLDSSGAIRPEFLGGR